MAEWFWPCPICGQQQRSKTQANEAQEVILCAACAEAEAKREQALEDFSSGKTLVGKARK